MTIRAKLIEYKRYIIKNFSAVVNCILSIGKGRYFLRGRGWKIYLKKTGDYFVDGLKFVAKISKEWMLREKQLLLINLKLQKEIILPGLDTFAVAIVVSLSNKYQNSYMCLQSISLYTKKKYRIFALTKNIKDSGLSKVNNIIVIEYLNNDDNLLTHYQLVKEMIPSGAYILFLDGDCLVTEGYLEAMLSLLEKNKCDVVSGKIVDVYNKTLLSAGKTILKDGTIKIRGFGELADKPEYSYVHKLSMPAEECMLVRKKDLDIFCEGDTLGRVSSISDVLRNNNCKILFQPRAIIKHQDSQKLTNFTSNKTNPANSLEELCRNDPVNNTKILVLDDYIPAMRYGSGFPRLYEILSCLSELGYFVTFFPVGYPVNVQPETSQLQEMGVEVFGGKYANIKLFTRERQNQYDIVFISRPHVFKKYYTLVKESFLGAAILYDAEALFYTREQAKAKIKGEMENKQIANLERQEMQLLERADFVISVSQREKEIMLRRSSQKNIEVWGHIQDVKKNRIPFNQRHGILFLGSFFAGSGSPNEDAALYFARDVFPKILEKIDCILYIVGASPTNKVKRLASRQIEVTGYVENLEDYFYKCRVNVVPTRFAAGIPLKLVQTMSYGIPSIVSPLIAEQLDLRDGEHVLVAATPQEYVEKVFRLYSQQELWNELSRASMLFVESNFSRRILQNKMNVIIQESVSFHRLKR
jgi:glycosyltransferase involved in cell wall biosynthesis